MEFQCPKCDQYMYSVGAHIVDLSQLGPTFTHDHVYTCRTCKTEILLQITLHARATLRTLKAGDQVLPAQQN